MSRLDPGTESTACNAPYGYDEPVATALMGAAPAHAPPISGDRGLFVQAPLHTCRLGSLLFFSGRDIEDDLASENVRRLGIQMAGGVVLIGRARPPEAVSAETGTAKAERGPLNTPTPLWFPWINPDEVISVGNLHLGQGLGIDDIGFADNSVQVQDIGRQRIDFLVRQGFWRAPRHRPPHIIKNDRSVGPVANSPVSWKRTQPANERTCGDVGYRFVGITSAFLAMA